MSPASTSNIRPVTDRSATRWRCSRTSPPRSSTSWASSSLDEVDRLVVDFTVAVTNNARRIPERMFEALRAHFSEAQIVELTLRIALCGFFNRFNDALQIDNELEEAVHAAK